MLIVEDSDLYFKIYKKIAETLDIEHIFSAKTIKEGIEIIKENHIELLILDLTLPDGNGRDLVKYIREDIKNKEIFIVVSTTEMNEAYIINLFDIGIDYYFSKPFNPAILKALLNRILQRKREA